MPAFIMRPWYRYKEQYDDRPQRMIITPFSRVWGFGAPYTIALIIVNVAIWLVMVVTDGLGWLPFETWWYEKLGMTPQLVLKGHVYQVLTSIFLHDGRNFLHVFFNMYILWVFGPRIERTFTSNRFLLLYIVCGAAGNILSLLMRSLAGDMDTPSLGASAAIFGILVVYGFLFANEKLLLFFVIPLTVWKAVVGFIVMETLLILFGLMVDVDHWAHLGGAAAGAIWMLLLIHRTGHKTAHGWRHAIQPPSRHRTTPGPIIGQRTKDGFRIIIGGGRPVHEDHPEGTDDEPPPEWFNP